MSLVEPRSVKEFETSQFPAFRKRVEEAAGFPCPWRFIGTAWLSRENRASMRNPDRICFEPPIAGLT